MKAVRVLLIMLSALLLFSGCGEGKKNGSAGDAALPTESPTFSPSDEIPDAEATFRRSTLYFLSDEGCLVPVTKLIPWEEGIAKACLSYMTGSPVNDEAAKALGLKTVIPEGTELTISISDGNALVDIGYLPKLPDAYSELSMVEAIVNTLVGFSTVNTVTVTKNGEGGRLENGTELPVRREAYLLNPENTELETAEGASPATLYFPNLSGAVTVPVTRYLDRTPTVYSVVSALVSGPRTRGLRSCFPEDTLLLGAALENGAVTVNFSEDFKSAAEVEGLYSLAVKTLYLTLGERFDFDSLIIQVNGERFEPEKAERPSSVNGG